MNMYIHAHTHIYIYIYIHTYSDQREPNIFFSNATDLPMLVKSSLFQDDFHTRAVHLGERSWLILQGWAASAGSLDERIPFAGPGHFIWLDAAGGGDRPLAEMDLDADPWENMEIHSLSGSYL